MTARIAMSASTWTGLAVIAGARTATGNARRASSRDRGIERNLRNDLIGCVGEYAAIAAVIERGRMVTADFFACDAPVYQPDLWINGVGFDAKAVALEPSRRYLILDRRAVATAASKGITAFVPVVSQFYGSAALVGRRITLDEAAALPLRDFGYGEAHAIPVEDLARQYYGMGVLSLAASTSGSPFTSDGEAVIHAAMAHGSRLGNSGISDLVAGVDIITGVLRLADSFAASMQARA